MQLGHWHKVGPFGAIDGALVEQALAALGAAADVTRAQESKTLRAGKGKMRNRRYVVRRGPLLVHAEAGSSKTSPLVRAFRNLPGVDIVHVDRLNLLQLAPGGHLGRFVIWTDGAFGKLEPEPGEIAVARPDSSAAFAPRTAP